MAKVTDALGRPHTGVLPYLVIGIVVDVNDPDKLGRVRVKFPTLDGGPESHWLRVLTPSAGKELGMYSLPDVNTEVLVGFLQGNHEAGIVLGQLWNGVDLPPVESDSAVVGDTSWSGKKSTEQPTASSSSYSRNDRRLWHSRSGAILMFDDTQGEESVHLWDMSRKLGLVLDTAKGALFLHNGTGDLHVRAQGNLYFEAGENIYYVAGGSMEGEVGGATKHKTSSDLTIEANGNTSLKTSTLKVDAQGSVEIKGMAVTVKGETQATLEGGVSAELKGKAMAKVTGGVVTIN